MKMLARAHVWWPGLDQELEELVNGCLSCQSHKHTQSVAPLHPWVWPTGPSIVLKAVFSRDSSASSTCQYPLATVGPG